MSRASTRSETTTRLLACGAAAGPLFVVAELVQDRTRADVDPAQQPLSLLSLGDPVLAARVVARTPARPRPHSAAER